LITEKRFALSHHDFWHDLLPMGEHYIRTANLAVKRYCQPLKATFPHLNGVINELSFRLFAVSVHNGIEPEDIPPEVVSSEADNAVNFIRRFRQHSRTPVRLPLPAETAEAIQLTKRTRLFFQISGAQQLTCRPNFPGCGWLSECDGDVLAGKILHEIKAGERSFRMLDIRQTLTYCALNYSAHAFEIDGVCLLNPREGVYFHEDLSALCEALSGRSPIEILGDII
jgi:hypothetical protein